MSKTEKCPRPPKLGTNEEQALRLRTLGLTYREIAGQLQVPVSTAYGRVMRGLRELRKRQHEAPNDVRHIELLKLAQLERRVMAEAVSGDHAAIRLLLRIMDARKRYLATCLPSTSSKEELDELLRVFTQPIGETFGLGDELDSQAYGEIDEGRLAAALAEAEREERDDEDDGEDGEDGEDGVAGGMTGGDLFPAVADLAPAVT